MVENKETVILKDGMDNTLRQLNALRGTIGVLKSGLESEGVEQQAVDCLECIDECLKNICTFMLYSLKDFDACVKDE